MSSGIPIPEGDMVFPRFSQGNIMELVIVILCVATGTPMGLKVCQALGLR